MWEILTGGKGIRLCQSRPRTGHSEERVLPVADMLSWQYFKTLYLVTAPSLPIHTGTKSCHL